MKQIVFKQLLNLIQIKNRTFNQSNHTFHSRRGWYLVLLIHAIYSFIIYLKEGIIEQKLTVDKDPILKTFDLEKRCTGNCLTRFINGKCQMTKFSLIVIPHAGQTLIGSEKRNLIKPKLQKNHSKRHNEGIKS